MGYLASHGAPSPVPAVVVFARPGGLNAKDRAAVAASRDALAKLRLPGTSRPTPVQVAPDGAAANFEVLISRAGFDQHHRL